VPIDKLCKSYRDIKCIDDVEVTLKDQIEHFFTYYKDLDEGKWVIKWQPVIKYNK
jgi:inorganic pyrophosphatase